MVLADGKGTPLAVHLDSATPAEVTLIEQTLTTVFIPRNRKGRYRKKIQCLIYDKAADCDKLRQRLRKRGIELIAPHRCNRVKKMQDGRPLRRYKRRYIIERTFAWIGHYHRLLIRWEKSITMYKAFFHIACMMITLNKVLK